MKRLLFGLLLLAGNAFAFDLKGDKAIPVFADDGDSMAAFSVNVGSSTAQLFFTPRGVKDRRLVVCNPTSAFLYVSTFSAANATTSPRGMVEKGVCYEYPSHVQLWAIFEAGTSTTTVVGFDQYEARD